MPKSAEQTQDNGEGEKRLEESRRIEQEEADKGDTEPINDQADNNLEKPNQERNEKEKN